MTIFIYNNTSDHTNRTIDAYCARYGISQDNLISISIHTGVGNPRTGMGYGRRVELEWVGDNGDRFRVETDHVIEDFS